jgi:histidyl-tRNA synthetase
MSKKQLLVSHHSSLITHHFSYHHCFMGVKTQPARGMRDFLPGDVRRREYVIRVVKEVYERYGFEPLETPAVENIETLMGKYGEEGNQLIFKILKRGVHEATGEADLALRYDLTVPLARVVAEYRAQLPKFFKRYQIQPVWRADRPARGRFREFYQCDVDVLGSRSMIVEAELCAAQSEALTKLGFTNFTIRLNHRQVLTGLLEAAGISSEKHNDALVALDKLDKISHEGVVEELNRRGIVTTDEMLEILFIKAQDKSLAEVESQTERGFDLADYNTNLLMRLRERIGNNTQGSLGLYELSKIIDLTKASVAGPHVQIDTNLVRGLSYYTGAIMEISVPDLAGSLGGGGRYDNLVGMFLGQDVPACGFSLGLERIIVLMTEREMFPPALTVSPADVMLTIWDEDSMSDSLALAKELRGAGLRVDLYPEADKIGKQLKYAAAQKIPFVVVTGADERARGLVSLKEMSTGEQQTVSLELIAETIRERLKSKE